MQKTNLYHQAEQLLLEYQSMHRMRNTPERLKILQWITSHKGKFSPADLVEYVKPFYISMATVYNTLRILESAHIVHCLHKQHGGRQMEYELSLGDTSSMQIICSKCGRVSRVNDKTADVALRMKLYPNFIMHHYSVYVFGECKHCARLTPSPLTSNPSPLTSNPSPLTSNL